MAEENNIVTKATLKGVRLSPRKARMALDLIKGQQIEPAVQILQHSPRRAAQIALKVLKSAIANARENSAVDVDTLWVTGGYVNMGKTLKRYTPRAQGRATPIRKRHSHITIELGAK